MKPHKPSKLTVAIYLSTVLVGVVLLVFGQVSVGVFWLGVFVLVGIARKLGHSDLPKAKSRNHERVYTCIHGFLCMVFGGGLFTMVAIASDSIAATIIAGTFLLYVFLCGCYFVWQGLIKNRTVTDLLNEAARLRNPNPSRHTPAGTPPRIRPREGI